MLFAIQFQHPANGTSNEFQLYPFRLIFKLLLDNRLDGKLYNNEVAYIVMFQKTISHEDYENLVIKILELRKLTNDEMVTLYKSDEHTYVKSVYEWEYYTISFLSQIGIIDKFDGEFLCKLYHPRKTNSHSSLTGRNATRGYISMNASVKSLIEKLTAEYSCFDNPIFLRDTERLYIDCVKEVYSFYPNILLEEIGEDDTLVKYLELPKHIEEYANNPDNDTAYLFEDVLTEGFNMFYNIKAIKRGGAAHTDIECLYITKKKNLLLNQNLQRINYLV